MAPRSPLRPHSTDTRPAVRAALLLAFAIGLASFDGASAREPQPLPSVLPPVPVESVPPLPPTSVRGPAADGGSEEPYVLRVPVLMYHRISRPPRDAGLPGLWVDPVDFRRQLSHLRAHGWVAVTAADVARHLAQRRPFPPKRFVISIDDGAIDGYTHAAPVLRRLGMRATFYVNPGRTWMRTRMSWDQLRELHAAGHEIANHSMTHANLVAADDEELHREVRLAQVRFERELGVRPVTLAYPFGYHDRQARLAVRAAGIRLAFTTAHGAWESTTDRYRAPRIRVDRGDSPARVLARLAPYANGR